MATMGKGRAEAVLGSGVFACVAASVLADGLLFALFLLVMEAFLIALGDPF
jgi:hypothetical protein